ncbi:hypothetical protein J4412_01640, partial [Candidatus Pacearchaeota archaeon]|nr:hypothetical protein [Candidatus Pacearchaeota archaeon]
IISEFKPSVNIVKLRLKDRITLIKKIVELLDSNFNFISKDFLFKLSRFYDIRNLFAHSPITDLEKELFFKDTGIYLENKVYTNGKNIQELSDELKDLLKFLLGELFKILQLINSKKI